MRLVSFPYSIPSSQAPTKCTYLIALRLFLSTGSHAIAGVTRNRRSGGLINLSRNTRTFILAASAARAHSRACGRHDGRLIEVQKIYKEQKDRGVERTARVRSAMQKKVGAGSEREQGGFKENWAGE